MKDCSTPGTGTELKIPFVQSGNGQFQTAISVDFAIRNRTNANPTLIMWWGFSVSTSTFFGYYRYFPFLITKKYRKTLILTEFSSDAYSTPYTEYHIYVQSP